MSLGLLLILATVFEPLSSNVEITPAVLAIANKHGKTFGPEAESELEALWVKGDRTAAALLGELLMMPNRTGGTDYPRSCDYSEKAGRHSSALHNSATCYFLGNGRPRNLTKARELYGQAMDMGYAKAACAFGNMLIGGQGGPADPARGVDLCRQAADTGLPDAQTDYAGYLLKGEHIAKDAAKARQYLLLAAEKGQPNAAYLLAQVYWFGDGIGKDVPQAAIWWIRSYEGGRKDAAFRIGMSALSLVIEGAKAERKAPTAAIDQAKKWLAIASREDPDPAQRKKAEEMLALLENLLAGRQGAS